MSDNTASQAVDERQTMMEVLSMCIDALSPDADRVQRETAAAKAIHVLGRAALKAQPAPTEAQGKPAWAPAYLSGTVLSNTNSGGGKVTLHFDAVGSAAAAFEDFIAMQEGKAQLSGNPGELAQGEDSARLDAERYRYLRDTGTLETAVWEALEGYGCTDETGELDQVTYARSMDIAIDNAIDRASGETGGVKS